MKLFITILLMSYVAITNASGLTLLSSWDEDNGPGGREHSASWIYDSKYYMVGGYGFSPYQGVENYSLWEFDLDTKQWTLLPTKGHPASSSARSYPLGEQNGIISMSRSPISFGRDQITSLHRLEIIDGIGVWTRIDIPIINQETLDFVKRSPRLSSLIYNRNDNSFYSTCTLSDCDTYKITIDNNVANIVKVKINGDTPHGRLAYAYGFSQKSNTLIIASGQMIRDGKTQFSNDIWTLDLNNKVWTKYEHVMTQRRNPCFHFHEEKQELLIWGGTNDGVSSLAEAHVFNLEEKKFHNIYSHQLDQQNRSSCIAAYDEDYGIITGFGNTLINNETSIYLDLWQYL